MKKLIVVAAVLLVITPVIVVVMLELRGHTETFCDSIEFDRSPSSVTLLHTTPDYSDILVFNETRIFYPPEGEPVAYGCRFSRFHEYQAVALFSDLSKLRECVRLDALPPEVQESLLATDFQCARIVIVQIIHGKDDKTQFCDYEIAETSVEFCFRERSPFRGGDDEEIPRQYIFLVDFCGAIND